ncbi:MAG: hypothetical protein R6U15_08325 [Candidatus Izemoplasmatales bacterium]
MIRKITKKDKSLFQDYCSRFGKNLFTDCSFKNLEIEFNKLIKQNNFCILDDENGTIRGLLFITKINNEYYINTIYKNSKILDRLLTVLTWGIKKDLIFKINDYKSVFVIKKHFFKFKEKIDKDYIYFRKYYQKVKKHG